MSIYTGLVTFIGGEIHSDELPQNVNIQAIAATAFKVQTETPIKSLDGTLDNQSYRVVFDISGPTRALVVSEGQRILTKIVDFSGAMGDVIVQSITMLNDIDDYEIKNAQKLYKRYIETRIFV